MNEDLLNFVREEMAARGPAAVAQWRETLKSLFELTLREGMPGYKEAPSFRAAEGHARNAEVALFLTLTACARLTLQEGECLTLDWIDEYGAGEFLRRTVGAAQ